VNPEAVYCQWLATRTIEMILHYLFFVCLHVNSKGKVVRVLN
jgi:hypothetical protein